MFIRGLFMGLVGWSYKCLVLSILPKAIFCQFGERFSSSRCCGEVKSPVVASGAKQSSTSFCTFQCYWIASLRSQRRALVFRYFRVFRVFRG